MGRIMVGRSREPSGPYADAERKPVLAGESILERPEGDLLSFMPMMPPPENQRFRYLI